MSPVDLAFDVVELLTLSLHQDCHVQENLVQLLEVPFQVFYCIMPLLDLVYGV